jgi:hypothetical protein
MKIGDKVKVLKEPTSLPIKYAGMVGEIAKHGFGDNWLVRLDENLWWVKGYDLAVIVDD